MSKRPAKPEPAALPHGPGFIFERSAIKLIGVLHVVCPLLFFTNLTRNPYYTQIAILNGGIAICGILWAIQALSSSEIRLPLTPVSKVFAAFIVVALVSTIHSWIIHASLRPGLTFESLRVWIFTIVNSFMAFYLPLLYSRPIKKATPRLSIWTDITCAALWAAFWYGFSEFRNTDPRVLMWDPYGAFLWALALLYVWIRVKNGDAIEYFHLIFAVAFLAGLYGTVQYMGRDIIWSSPVTPYGGRPVSTFGNPNFLSSYLLLVSPVALGFSLSTDRTNAPGYLLISIVSAVSAICTLTRSTYVGLLAAFIVMGIFLYRRENAPLVKKVFLGAALLIALVFIFPGSPVNLAQSPLARFTEIFDAMKSGESYGPWHQRILIWSSAFDMLKERPLFGKGWGSFELFYPFYQGRYLFDPVFAHWRTHANNAHNVVMEFLAQVGFVGTGVVAWMFVVLSLGAIRVVRRSEGSSRLVSAGLLAGWIGMIVDNFFGNVSIFFAVPAFLFWWNLGAVFNESDEPAVILRPAGQVMKVLLVLFISMNVVVCIYFAQRWNEEVHYFSGFKYAKTGYVVESIKELEIAYHSFAGDVNNNYELGNSYARQAKTLLDKKFDEEANRYIEKAIVAYQSALNANPGYDEIYFNLGVTLIQTGKVEEGIKNLRMALLINPLLHGGYDQLAQYYAGKGELQKAVETYEISVAAFPRDKNFWNNLGVVYSNTNQHDKALAAYEKAYSLDVTFVQAFQNLKAAAQKMNVKEPLLEIPNLLDAMNRGVESKQYDKAMVAADRLWQLVPQNEQIGLARAKLFLLLNDYSKATEQLQAVLKLNLNSYEAYLNLGYIYRHEKDFEAARRHFQTALDINSQSVEAQQALASLK